MIGKLRVWEVQDVEIPDLQPPLMKVVEEYGAEIDLDIRESSYDEGGVFHELYVEISGAADDRLSDTFDKELDAAGYDESKMSGEQPYFQTDGPDGKEVLEKYVEMMKATYPNVKFT